MTKRSRLLSELFFQILNGPTIECPGPAEIDHSKAGTVRLSDVYCILLNKIVCISLDKIPKTYVKNASELCV
jgi:hypothetical protein